MQDTLNVERALKRLAAIDWRNRKPEQHQISNAMLMREYLRREEMWRDELAGTLNESFA